MKMRYNEGVPEREVVMMKRRSVPRLAVALSAAAVLVGGALLAGAFSPAPEPGPSQETRPEFYVARVLSSKDVKDPDAVLGKPDGRFAEVAPGGRMSLLMEKPILPSLGFDDGLVVAKGEADFGLEGLFLAGEGQDAPERAWMPLVAGMSPGGFRLSSESLERTPEGSPGVKVLRISNNGAKTLFLDAVVGYGRSPRASLAP